MMFTKNTLGKAQQLKEENVSITVDTSDLNRWATGLRDAGVR